jgi:uncharacterized protein DUF3800
MSSPETCPIWGKVAYPLDSQPDLERSFVGRVAQSLYPCGRLFVILTAYYDESGTHAESPATVLAGFVGDTNDWVDFEIEWAKVLKAHKITHVRAKHLFHRQNQHKDWSWDQADELIAAILYLLQERKHMFASKTVLREDDYKMFYVAGGPEKKERLDTRYGLCFRSLLHFIPEVQKLSGAHSINFVLEDGHKNAGDALRVYQEIRNDKTFPWRDVLASFSLGQKQASPALQAADFLAYMSYLEVRDDIEDGNEGKVLRDDGIDFELVWGCGITVLESLIHPKDLTTMRANFLRKNKLPIFPLAWLNGGPSLVETASRNAQGAGLRPSIKH